MIWVALKYVIFLQKWGNQNLRAQLSKKPKQLKRSTTGAHRGKHFGAKGQFWQ